MGDEHISFAVLYLTLSRVILIVTDVQDWQFDRRAGEQRSRRPSSVLLLDSGPQVPRFLFNLASFQGNYLVFILYLLILTD
jgi:hypothetical protein